MLRRNWPDLTIELGSRRQASTRGRLAHSETLIPLGLTLRASSTAQCVRQILQGIQFFGSISEGYEPPDWSGSHPD